METEILTREQLYTLVWSQSMLALSKKYQISDVELRKMCIRMNIPLPQAGHWQKIQFGKKIHQTPLSNKYEGDLQVSLKLRDPEKAIAQRGESPLSVLKGAIEDETSPRLIVPDRLNSPDPLIVAARNLHTNQKADNYLYKGTVSSSRGILDIRVAPENISRALRLWTLLLRR